MTSAPVQSLRSMNKLNENVRSESFLCDILSDPSYGERNPPCHCSITVAWVCRLQLAPSLSKPPNPPEGFAASAGATFSFITISCAHTAPREKARKQEPARNDRLVSKPHIELSKPWDLFFGKAK